MTPEEFERLKEEEKKHLRELRALKQQHRDVQRKKSVFDALRGMARPDLDAAHDEAVGKLTGDAALAEARLDLALEGQAPGPAPTEAERQALRAAEAESLVRQMKASMGEALGSAPAGSASATGRTAGAAPPAAGKTLGRAPAADPTDASAPPADRRGAKTIGRPRPNPEGDATGGREESGG